MERQFQLLTVTRKNITDLLEGYGHEKLNKIPEGFSNNLAWNLGHILVTQQILHYQFSDLDFQIDDELVHKYKKGSFPREQIYDGEIDYIKSKFIDTIGILRKDYTEGKFKSYSKYTTSYNAELNSIEDAIEFNNIHESMHFGYIKALVKLL